MIDPVRQPALRWVVLAVGLIGQASTCVFSYGLPSVLPSLRAEKDLSLFAATVVIVAPIAGLLLTLIAWGAAADRYGERRVMAIGTALAAGFLAIASQVTSTPALVVFLVLAGAGGSAVNAASGRLVMGWFSPQQRGLAMGIRQTAQPLGIGLAALVLPPLDRAHGFGSGLVFCAAASAVAAALIAMFAIDPPRPHRDLAPTQSPYHSSMLWRIHLTSILLVVPQFAVSAFTLVYLVEQRGWDPVVAGQLVFWFQLAGAAARIGSGVWSDRVGSRLRPIMQLAAAGVVLMVAISVAAAVHEVWIVGAFALAAVVTVSDNGLAFTAVAEYAGPFWAGRALATHNTGQNVAGLLTPPLLAAVIGDTRYALGFALVAIFPLIAIPLIPWGSERPAELEEFVSETA